jgi:hypothetical protein
VITLPARERGDIATQIRLVREQAVARVSEVDLLVAALRDHVRDLQAERDFLRAELVKANARTIAEAAMLLRGQKQNRA